MRLFLICHLLILCTLFFPVESWWLLNSGNDRGCPRRGNARAYYFGTTDLNCMMGKKGKLSEKGKRSAPIRGAWDYTHRFIYYRGKYFEFLSKGARIGTWRASDHCTGRTERSPAGYSYLSLYCIQRCARSYENVYGPYNPVTNNCHIFANRMSKVLCRRGYMCPSWCN